MVTAEERMRILQMLKEGKITPEAAAQLLEAMGDGAEQEAASQSQAALPAEPVVDEFSGRKPRWLHVRVTDTNTGRPRVNVRMPISLVNLGLKLGARYSPEIEGLDLAELLHAAQVSDAGSFVDVYDEEDGEHVEVFLE